MRVYVAGAEGFLGARVVEALRAAGHELCALPASAEAVAILADARAGSLEEASRILVAGTARLLDGLASGVKRIVVAAAADAYGEGPAECVACGHVRPENRHVDASAPWDPRCPRCEGALQPVAVREEERFQVATPLAALRISREELVRSFGRLRGIETVSLRFPCLYGAGATDGVFASVVSELRAGRSPILTEDGLQTRDFLDVRDAARAVCVALGHPRAAGHVFNVGTGKFTRVLDLARLVAASMGVSGDFRPSGRVRPGDARHIALEPRMIQYATGWRAAIGLAAGVEEALGREKAPAAP